MLQAHSFLWHFLWVEPNVLLLLLAVLMWKRGLHKQLPAFFVFAASSSIGQLCIYTADVIPSVSAETFWRADWADLLTEGTLKFVVIGGIFGSAFGPYPSIAKLGKLLIRGVGVALVLAAAIAAAYAPTDSPYGLISGAHLLEQTIFLVETGIIASILIYSKYFHLLLNRQLFGIALGLGISSCVHLAAWATIANAGLPNATRYSIDFVTMGTYNVSVLVWYYFLLAPAKVKTGQGIPVADMGASSNAQQGLQDNLSNWNDELERLLH
jgi:hypothetical protein